MQTLQFESAELVPGHNGTNIPSASPRTHRYSVSFVLPAYNEEHNIVDVIGSCLSVGQRHCADFEVVVIDDGSTDLTRQLVSDMAATNREIRLICHGTNRGYGEALRSGFEAARCDYVFFTDADNQFDIEDLPLLLAWADDADIVAGYRRTRRDSVIRILNAWAWNRLVRFLFYVPVRDIDCAFKLFRRSALTQIAIESRAAMINTEIMVKLARAGCCIVEVGVSHRRRVAGQAQGAKMRVILRSLREVAQMYPILTALDATRESSLSLRHG